jgi:hypothetical protein
MRGTAIALPWLVAACGRLQFERHSDAVAGSGSDGRPPVSHIAYTGVFVQRNVAAGSTDSFIAQARAAGDAVVIQVACSGPEVPTGVSVSATGWMFQQLGPITISPSTERAATMYAVSPDTAPTTITVTWTGSPCSGHNTELGDEFSPMTPAVAITLDGVNAIGGTGDCAGSVTTSQSMDAVWGACLSHGALVSVGAGFTKGADDGLGDWSEYAITSDPAGTVENVSFGNGSQQYVLSMVTLKSQ